MATGGLGMGCLEIGTQPMAAARANGSHAATDAMVAARWSRSGRGYRHWKGTPCPRLSPPRGGIHLVCLSAPLLLLRRRREVAAAASLASPRPTSLSDLFKHATTTNQNDANPPSRHEVDAPREVSEDLAHPFDLQ